MRTGSVHLDGETSMPLITHKDHPNFCGWVGSMAVLILTLAGVSPLFMHAASEYQLLKKYSFGAASGSGREYFDYITIDSAARRVYLSHGTEIKVIDADNGSLITDISGLQQTHGVALASEFGRGFITDGGQGKVIIFDLQTFKVTGEVKADKDADCIIYDPFSKRVFVMNGDPHTSTVIDARSGDVVGTIELGGGPEFAVSDGRGSIYVNLEDKGEVVVIDAKSLKIKSRWPVSPAGAPTAITMDTQHHRLFSAGRDPQKVVLLDSDSGKVLQALPISSGADAAVYEPETALLFVSTREGFVHVFHEDTTDKLSEVEVIKTEYGAKTMAFDKKTRHVIVDTADFAPAPVPTAERPHPPRPAIQGTFHVLIYSK
jgi:DNA-binding beta-propeller fold protein YncE